jgi:hypothetical protein
MRGLMVSAAVMLVACTAAAPAGAQADDAYAGTWAFQTASYGNEQIGAIMSGAAVISPAAPNRYDIRLIANERIVNRNSGENLLITARQTCTGELDGAQFTISCQMAEPLEGYEPDNFVLQQGEEDQLIGVLSSNTSSQVTFTRLR